MSIFSKKTKKEPQDLRELLSQFKELGEKFSVLAAELEEVKKKNIFNIQKVGLIRFNPFKEVGSDQSFSIAILDGQNSGAVITSLYTREGNRVYGKPVKDGKSEYLLSEEEERAISETQNPKQ